MNPQTVISPSYGWVPPTGFLDISALARAWHGQTPIARQVNRPFVDVCLWRSAFRGGGCE